MTVTKYYFYLMANYKVIASVNENPNELEIGVVEFEDAESMAEVYYLLQRTIDCTLMQLDEDRINVDKQQTNKALN